MVCDYCRSEFLFLKEQDGKDALYCKSCGRWLKWVDSAEKAKISNEIEKRKRELRIDGADLEIVREKYKAYKKKYESVSEELRYFKDRSAKKQISSEIEASAMYDKALKLKELNAKIAAFEEVLTTLRLK
jgi:ABC-type phosphate transport system auxiliary subunit